jgi:glycosyltransferase involved in cell wall biosynthesis
MTPAALQVSVITPVYNGAAYLAEALRSVARQTLPALEAIVVDDGSTDHSAEVARAFAKEAPFPVRYFRQDNRGAAAARNAGIGLAQGDLLAFLDADDAWLPGKLERQVDCLARHPEAACAICHMHAVVPEGEAWPAERNYEHYATDPPAYIPSALIVRRSTFDRVGLFDATFRTSEDSDWFFRVRDASLAIAVVPEVLLVRRLRSGSLSQVRNPGSPNLLRVVRASVRRKLAETPEDPAAP